MAKEYGRHQRVADQVQRELAVVIQRKMGSESGMITLSGADVSPDLKNAKVYFTALAEEGNNAEANHTELEARLNEMAGHFRHHLAKILPLRVVPKLTFIYDESIARASRLSALIDTANKH